MNSFSILKQDHAKIFPCLRNPCPLPDSSVCLNLRMVGMFHHAGNPFLRDYSTVRSLADMLEIFGCFHYMASLLSILNAANVALTRPVNSAYSSAFFAALCSPRFDSTSFSFPIVFGLRSIPSRNRMSIFGHIAPRDSRRAVRFDVNLSRTSS